MAGLQDTTPRSHCYCSLCLCPHPPFISTTCHITQSYRCAFSQLWQITTHLTHLTLNTHLNARSGAQLCHRQRTEHQTKMKTPSAFLLVLIFCHLCRAQKHSGDYDILHQAPDVESDEEKAQTQKPGTEADEELVFQSDIWVELRSLRDMVVAQKVELRHLTARVTAAETLVDALEKENTGTL